MTGGERLLLGDRLRSRSTALSLDTALIAEANTLVGGELDRLSCGELDRDLANSCAIRCIAASCCVRTGDVPSGKCPPHGDVF